MVNLSIIQGCIDSGHFIYYVTNRFFLLDGMHVAEVSFSVQTILCMMQSLTLPTLTGSLCSLFLAELLGIFLPFDVVIFFCVYL